MKSEECEDETIFLLFRGHGMGKHAPSGGGHYSLRGTLFSSEYCPGGHCSRRGDTIHSDNGAGTNVTEMYHGWKRGGIEVLYGRPDH